MRQNRRNLLRLFLTLPWIGHFTGFAVSATPTPGAAEGPFYPTPNMRFRDADNNLLQIEGSDAKAQGTVVVLTGKVTNATGEPVDNARVEIWQCDANGRYLHTGDSGSADRDPGFQGFGHVVTNESGAYAFRTIMPVPYPGRTPHIHVKVISGGNELTTQFYIAGNPENERDSLFRRLSAEERRQVEMHFADGPDGRQTQLDIMI